jgi:isoleucyl-tRNA synthetase
MLEFRKECRAYAEHWVAVQSEEFKRLGIEGDFDKPYKTMDFHAEARIAGELLKIAKSGQLYRGSKPIMWSVVERTALAEAEVEYQPYESDTIWVKFPVVRFGECCRVRDTARRSSNRTRRAASLATCKVLSSSSGPPRPGPSPATARSHFRTASPMAFMRSPRRKTTSARKPGEKLIFADALAEECFAKAKLEFKRLRDVAASELEGLVCAHPLKGLGGGYDFAVPLIDGDHVTDDAGTGFVHTAPGHGREDFEAWMDAARDLEARGISTRHPLHRRRCRLLHQGRARFRTGPRRRPARVIDDKGKKGDANQAVITALIEADNLFARGRLKHDLPAFLALEEADHLPQHAAVVCPHGQGFRRRHHAAQPCAQGHRRHPFCPASGQNRLRGMIEDRPDWVLSRQRAWGVPICVFADADGNVLVDEAVNARILEAFETEGADAWFAEGARERFLGNLASDPKWIQVTDILDVWFDSGCTHVFTLEDRPTSNGRPMSISKAPTSTAAGSIPRCSKAAHARPRAL